MAVRNMRSRFWSGNTEYDYDIDAVSGEIRSYDHDAEYYSPAQNSSSNNTSSGSSNSSYITEAEAKAVALAHAGLSESDVTFVRAHLDYDDGRAEYEIEFWSGNTEYDYDIDAVSGEIRSYDHDASIIPPLRTVPPETQVRVLTSVRMMQNPLRLHMPV